MVVRGMVLAGVIAATLGAGPGTRPALAQGAPGAYGGGFIEYLMTGQDPGPSLARCARCRSPRTARS